MRRKYPPGPMKCLPQTPKLLSQGMDDLNSEDMQDTGDFVHGYPHVSPEEMALPPKTAEKTS